MPCHPLSGTAMPAEIGFSRLYHKGEGRLTAIATTTRERSDRVIGSEEGSCSAPEITVDIVIHEARTHRIVVILNLSSGSGGARSMRQTRAAYDRGVAD